MSNMEMLTTFQRNALRAIAACGGVQAANDESTYTRKGVKWKRKFKIVDVNGARVAVGASDGTYGFIGMPTMDVLEEGKFIKWDGERKLYVATGKDK